MSSPFTYGEPSPLSMPAGTVDDDDDPASEIPRRLMRVKVLYTFDDSHKTCCLARLPNALNIPTVMIDEDTQVGVIELRTCIEAIVNASPELVAKLGHDYTVYAYDYSEYETPLVGQGMLSWILASTSSTPDAPANRSKTMVTGKVRENILGLFSGGIKETLEVKLKLVPVPTFLQSEYLETMERYRNVSKANPEGYDHNQWTTFKSNPELNAFAAQIGTAPGQPGLALQRVNSGGVESLHQLLTQNMSAGDERRGSQYHVPTGTQSHQGSRQGSRAGSPTPSMRSSAALQQITHDHSRPASRASHTSERPVSHHGAPFEPRMGPSQSQGQESEHEDGPPRKRARVVQADWRGKSQFGPRADTLRITASTAASVRVHKPTPINLAAGLSNSLEPPPRAPTPRPNELPQARHRASVSGTSSLRKESSSAPERMRRYASPYAPRGPYSESAIASEDEQMADAEDSPADFPSSPPVFTQNDSPAPSSPGLPTFPYPDDSGFMSGAGMDQDFDVLNTDKPDQGYQHQMEPQTEPQTEPPSAVPCSDQWQMETPGPPELLPTNVGRKQPHYKSQRAAASAAARQVQGPKQETRGRKRNDTKPPPPPPPPQKKLAPVGSPQISQALPALNQSSPNFSYPPPSQQPLPQLPAQSQPQLQGQSNGQNQPIPRPHVQPQPQLNHQPQLPPGASPQTQPFPSSASPTYDAATTPSDASGSASQRSSKLLKKTSTAPKAKKSLPRSNTWSAGTPSEFQLDEPSAPICESRSASPAPRSGSGAKRKKAIEDRLMQSLADGTMPDFCACCGAIQTPTWRKAFYKEYEGAPKGIVTSLDEPGAIVGYEIMQPHPDEKNPVAKYRVFKKNLTNVDKTNGDFTVMQLCNPCGLHFAKFGNMRPPERWEVKPRSSAPKKRGRPSRRKKNDDKQTLLTSDAPQEPNSALYTDYPDEILEYMQWPQQSENQQDKPRKDDSQQDKGQEQQTQREGSQDESQQECQQEDRQDDRQEEPPLKRQRITPGRRATSLEPQREDSSDSQGWGSTVAGVALIRAIHSSPPRLVGSQDSPINPEDDVSPVRPTRRILFPSPRRTGQFKSLEDGQKEKEASHPAHGQKPHPPQTENTTGVQDKENVPPVEDDDHFAHLFEENEIGLVQVHPKTPRSSRSIRSIKEFTLKTPTSKSKRVVLTPKEARLSPADVSLNVAFDEFLLTSTPSKGMKTPKNNMTPWTRSMHELFGAGKTPRSSGVNAGWGISSPGTSALIDFSDFDFAGTDMPFPSSPPNFGASFSFSLYEDPLTSTNNFWGGTSIFDGSSDPAQGGKADGEHPKDNTAQENRAVELGRIIEEVTGNADKGKDNGKEVSLQGFDTTVTTTENAGETPASDTAGEAVDLLPAGA